MLVVNRLTKPGDIKRVDIDPRIVKVTLDSGEVREYICGTHAPVHGTASVVVK